MRQKRGPSPNKAGLAMAALVVAVALGLAGCDRPDAGEPAPGDTPQVAAPEREGETSPAAAPDAALASIPARFLGVWDTGDCSPSSEMRLKVTTARLEYYESVGTLTAIEAASGGDVLATLAMTGEGQSWKDTVRLQLTRVEGREALLVLPGPESEVTLRPAPRFRCPA